ncbi:CDP-diacylglycerol--serine O-phosphatidyltransferase [Falsirhodobacter algicola]|uniref:CDP-diacylglycerol--serine O-phosphatidyltransferase n=1 Tax=Falsirhodobacter algicola TaxID=2692330 RepID=A0A8J8SL69_9RHOB|nr:CDP-diacylglycerol--serine O-phosphatidyltransferase [Falsirhodobacter algicola]QUS36177.1 CDP-diacylglycerol--serine O-phosphatidyltransferase [Falsirhodobacter algicola]
MPESRSRRLTFLQLLPNIMTLGAICAGITSIRFATEGRVDQAIALIILAAILDGLDGRVARMLRSESPIGAELDSLADFVNFGVATGLLVYFPLLHGESRLGWVAVLIYAVCCVMRLARFNVGVKTPDAGAAPGYFTGVPSPAGALLALLPIALDRALVGIEVAPALVALWLVVVGLLLVSRIPTPSLKQLRIPREKSRYVVICAIGCIALVFTWPWEALLAADLAYLGVILWAIRTRARHEKPEGA